MGPVGRVSCATRNVRRSAIRGIGRESRYKADKSTRRWPGWIRRGLRTRRQGRCDRALNFCWPTSIVFVLPRGAGGLIGWFVFRQSSMSNVYLKLKDCAAHFGAPYPLHENLLIAFFPQSLITPARTDNHFVSSSFSCAEPSYRQTQQGAGYRYINCYPSQHG